VARFLIDEALPELLDSQLAAYQSKEAVGTGPCVIDQLEYLALTSRTPRLVRQLQDFGRVS
jgi:hypothetical protein